MDKYHTGFLVKRVFGIFFFTYMSMLTACGGGNSKTINQNSSETTVSSAKAASSSDAASSKATMDLAAKITGINSATTGKEVTLDASNSTSDQGSLTYAWQLVSQPVGSFTELKKPNTGIQESFITDIDGAYIIKLTVYNASGLANSTTITVTSSGNPFKIRFTENQGVITSDQLYVSILLIKSEYEINSIIARVENKSTPLVYSNFVACNNDCIGGFRGFIDITDLSYGEHVVEVVVTDVKGTISTSYLKIFHDNPPHLSISSPANYNLALPSTDISASCNDDSPSGCTIDVFLCNDKLVSSNENKLDQSVDLSAYLGSSCLIKFSATDSQGQVTQVSRTIFVENSANLIPVLKTDGNILDAQRDHLLYLTSDQSGNSLKLLNRNDNSSLSVKPPENELIRSAYISNYGAMFVAGESRLDAKIYDWNNGTLYNLGPDSLGSVQVNGDFAIWNKSSSLIKRDLSSLTNTELSSHAGNWKNDIASNGATVWWDNDYQINFNNGVTTQITSDQLFRNTYPITDGHSSVYLKSAICCNEAVTITLFNGDSEVALGSARSDSPDPLFDYQIHDNWIAYTEIGKLTQINIWTYDPLGQRTQRTYFGSNKSYTRIESLGEAGELMLISNNKRYISTANGFLGEVSSGLGQSYQVNGEWYIYIGNQLFKVKNFYK